MYVILIYDVNVKRVSKMLKLCRQYLCWIQNSVFEGEISEAKLQELCNKIRTIIAEAKLQELCNKIRAIIDKDEDSIIIFSNKMGYCMNKHILGKERMSTDNFL